MSGSTQYTPPNSASSWFHPSEEDHETTVVYRPKAIAVIFVPGVMGSNLRSKENPRQKVWLPPDGTIQGGQQAWDWSGMDASIRQQMLDPNDCEVDKEGQLSRHHGPVPIYPALSAYGSTQTEIEVYQKALKTLPCGLEVDEAIERGWGSVHWDSYGEILEHLQTTLNPWAHGNEQGEESLVQSLTALLRAGGALNEAAEPSGAAIDTVDPTEPRKLADYQFPVYCAGYNWLKSNRDSAETIVSDWLPQFKQHCRTALRARWEGAIIVTHSMGGLVGRALVSLIEQEEKILGVVHGAMPANGAAAFYARMRAGSRDGTLIGFLTAEILGRSARETVPVLANAPGPLELLPTPDYERCLQRDRGHSQWLEAGSDELKMQASFVPYATTGSVVKTGEGPVITQQPEGSVVNDIYLNASSWYRLIADPALIDPAGILKQNPIQAFSSNVKRAMDFHALLEQSDGGYHPNTYAFYGNDTNTPSYGTVHWQCSVFRGAPAPQRVIRTLEDNYLGRLRLLTDTGEQWFNLAPPKDAGDGTVPSHSGRAPLGRSGVQALFGIRDLDGKDHQTVFNNEFARRCTEYGIIRIAYTEVAS